jgi:isopenicillin N synthase-like dioxygenase
MKNYTQIPLIDIGPIFSDGDKGMSDVAEVIRDVYTDIGFAYIYNHHVPVELVDSIFDMSNKFHSMPLTEKLRIRQNRQFRGYMPISGSTLKVSSLGEARKPNQSEAFILAHEVPCNDQDYILGRYLAGPNQWPGNLPGFREVVTDYNNQMQVLARKLVQVFSLAFGYEKNFLDHLFVNPTTFLRLQHYPEQPNFIPSDQFGIAPHTDYGFLTILAQDDKGGLQVKSPSGNWLDVPYIPGTFVLNSSDMLKRMTNDIFISTPHRVINRSGKSRYSVPFFFEPNMHALIDVLPKFLSMESEKLYDTIVYRDHLMKRINFNYEIDTKFNGATI